jgi:peptidoglycan/xylan/chitin deacetylase (PgdA/CDA1 family)
MQGARTAVIGTKPRLVLALGVALTLVLAYAGAAEPGRPFHWPHGARAAVSLAYDDALDSHLDNAIPQLDKYGLRGSFYLVLSNPSVRQRMAQWRAAALRGHELGNHTLFHQCARSGPNGEWVRDHRNLDTTSKAQMQDQIVVANTMLYAIDGRRERTFTAPCGDQDASRENYLALIETEFVAIKAGGGSGIAESMAQFDPCKVAVLTPVGLSGEQLIALVTAAGAHGTMLNLTFHGIGADYLSVSRQAHAQLLRYLSQHRARYWTDTFLNIMKYVKREHAAGGAPAAGCRVPGNDAHLALIAGRPVSY